MPDNLTPGCYGSTIAFDPKAPECLSCPYMDACAERAEAGIDAHVAHLEALDERFKTNFAERFKTSGAVNKRLRERESATVLAEIAALEKSGVLASQEANPFRGKVPYLELALLVLQARKRMRRTQLASLMKQKFTDLTEAQAASRASLAVAVLKRMGRATEKNGMIHA